METNQNPIMPGAPVQATEDKKQTLTQEEMLQAIYENTKKTMTYMKWQLYITVVLVVVPLLAMAIMLPLVMKSFGTLSQVYGPGGLLSQ